MLFILYRMQSNAKPLRFSLYPMQSTAKPVFHTIWYQTISKPMLRHMILGKTHQNKWKLIQSNTYDLSNRTSMQSSVRRAKKRKLQNKYANLNQRTETRRIHARGRQSFDVGMGCLHGGVSSFHFRQNVSRNCIKSILLFWTVVYVVSY